MLFLNLKLAFRNLLKNKVYSFLIIGGFAIGLAACILIGLFYHAETTVNKGFANHQRIYRVYDVKKNRCNLNWDLFPVLITDYGSVENACPLDFENREQLTVKNEETRESIEIKYILGTTNNFFQIFSVKIVESLSRNPLEGLESISISDKVAKALFGDESPLGKPINIMNFFYGTVTSVFADLPKNISFNADVILNSGNEKFRMSSTNTNGKRYNPTNVFVMLRKDNSPVAFLDQLNKSAKLSNLDLDSLALQPLDEIYLSSLSVKSRHEKGNPTLLKIFIAIASLILLLSSINYLNYSLSIQYARLRSSGIKRTFGADWKNLISYTFIEVTLGILVSLIAAVFFVDIALQYSEKLFGKALNVNWHDWLAVAPLFLAILILLILINSLGPIILLSKFSIIEFLSGYRGNSNRKHLWKKVLLAFQLTASTTLIAVVMIIFRQLNFVKHSDPGFDRELLLRINIPYKYKQTDAFRMELGKLPFVKNTTLSMGCPGMINMKMGNNSGESSFDVNCINVGEDYLKTLGIELKEGRDFMNGDLNKSCLLNEEAVRRFGWENLEGKKYDNGQEGGFDVVGIIKDFKFESYHYAIEPLALLYTKANINVLSVRLIQGNIGEQIGKMRGVWKAVSPDEPFSFIFYDDLFQAMYVKEEKLASSITFFSLIALALTCMGILGQVFMICLSRTKEIGIRKINGAKISEMLVMLNSYLIILFAIAFLVSVPASFFIMRKWLENFAYKTSMSWWVFALAGVFVLFIISITVSWQSWRAATRNPVEALRYE
jgi:putative ABC transport system permease protein